MGEDRTWTIKARFDSWGSDRLIWASRHHAPSVLGERVSVVEEPRLREAEAEVKRQNGWAHENLRRAERAEAELREAREALRFYADKENWKWDMADPPWPHPPVFHDLGNRARGVLG